MTETNLSRQELRRPSEDCPSEMTLARSLIADELPTENRHRLDQHLQACRSCATRLATLSTERRAFYQRYPELPPPDAPAGTRWSWIRVVWRFSPAFIAGVWVLFLLQPPTTDHSPFKGALTPAVSLHVERGGAVFEGRPEMRLKPGDRLRFDYSLPEGSAFLHIVNVDNDGRITSYYPGAADSLPINATEHRFLPGSIRLDDYRGRERIFCLFSRTPISIKQINEAVATARGQEGQPPRDIEAIDALPLDAYQRTYFIQKEP